MSTVIVGVDLSPTGLGLVALPLDWDLQWNRLESTSLGYSLKRDATPEEHMFRLRSVVSAACTFIRRCDATVAFLEGYPIQGGKAVYSMHLVCEVGGAMKLALAERLGISARTAPLSTARKILLGKIPRRGVKAAIQERVQLMGAPKSWNEHQIDAWVAANYGASELGGCCVAVENAA